MLMFQSTTAAVFWLLVTDYALSRGFNFDPFDVFNYFVCSCSAGDACCGLPKSKTLPKLLAFPN